ncbi:MAG: hypothetical protein ACRCUP_07820 [Mycoplasmatales bacterium]
MKKLFLGFLLALILSSYVPVDLIVYASTTEANGNEEKSVRNQAQTTIGTWDQPTIASPNNIIEGTYTCEAGDTAHSAAVQFTNKQNQKITYGYKNNNQTIPWYKTDGNIVNVADTRFPVTQVYLGGKRTYSSSTVSCESEEYFRSAFGTQGIKRNYTIDGQSSDPAVKKFPYSVAIYPDEAGTLYFEQKVTNTSKENLSVGSALKLKLNLHKEGARAVAENSKIRALADQTPYQVNSKKGLYQQAQIDGKFYTTSVIIDDDVLPFTEATPPEDSDSPSSFAANNYLVTGNFLTECPYGGTPEQQLYLAWRCQDSYDELTAGFETDTIAKDQVMDEIHSGKTTDATDQANTTYPGINLIWRSDAVRTSDTKTMVFGVNPNDNRVPPKIDHLELSSQDEYTFDSTSAPTDANAFVQNIKGTSYGAKAAKLLFGDTAMNDVTSAGTITATGYSNQVGTHTVTLEGTYTDPTDSKNYAVTKNVTVTINRPAESTYAMNADSHIVFGLQSTANAINKQTLLNEVHAQFTKDGSNFNGTSYANIDLEGFSTINQTAEGAYVVNLKGMDAGVEKASKKILIIFKAASTGIDAPNPNVPGEIPGEDLNTLPTKMISAKATHSIGKAVLGSGKTADQIATISEVKVWTLATDTVGSITSTAGTGANLENNQSATNGIISGNAAAGTSVNQVFKAGNATANTNWTVTNDTPVLTANPVVEYNVSASVSQSKLLTDANARISQFGTNVDNAIANGNITVDNTSFGQIDFTQPSVTVVQVNGQVNGIAANPVKVVVVVKDAKTELSPEKKVVITAKDFSMSIDKVEEGTTEAELKSTTYASVKAWDLTNTSTNGPVGTIAQSNISVVNAAQNKILNKTAVLNDVVPNTFSVTSSGATASTNVNGTITATEKLVLTATNYIKYDVRKAGDTNITKEQFYRDVNASLKKLGVEVSGANYANLSSNFDSIPQNIVQPNSVVINGAYNQENATPVTVKVIFSDPDTTVITPDKAIMIDVKNYSENMSALPYAAGDTGKALVKTKSTAKAWNLNTLTEIPVTIADTKLIQSTAKFTDKEEVPFTASAVVGAQTATKTAKATINEDRNIDLTSDDIVVYDKSNAPSESQFRSDINATITPEGETSSNFDTSVNENVVGVYEVTLTGTGLGQTKTKKVMVAIKDADTSVDKDNSKLMIRAVNFDEEKNNLPYATGTTGKITVKNKAEVVAWDLTTGQTVTVNVPDTKLTTSSSTFTRGEKVKVNFSATSPTTSKDISKEIEATVVDSTPLSLTAKDLVIYDKGNLPTTDNKFLTDAEANLQPDGTLSSNVLTEVRDEVGVYVVTITGTSPGKTDVEKEVAVAVKDVDTSVDETNKLMIQAYDFNKGILGLPLADLGKADSSAKAWDLAVATAGEITPTISENRLNDSPVTLRNNDKENVVVGAAVGQRTTSKTVEATILEDRTIALTANEYIEYDVNSSVDLAKFLADTNAELKVSGNKVDNTNMSVPLFNSINFSKVSAYVVQIEGSYEGLIATPKKVVVVIKDSKTVIDNDHKVVIRAQDFGVRKNELSAGFTADDAQTKATAKSWNISSTDTLGEIAGTNSISTITAGNELFNVNNSLIEGSEVPTTFTATAANKTATTTVKATVTDDRTLTLTGSKFIEYEKGSRVATSKFLQDIVAQLKVNGVNTSSGTISAPTFANINLDEVDAHIVEVHGTLEGLTAPSIKVIVAVTDENTDIDVTDPANPRGMVYAKNFEYDVKDLLATQAAVVQKSEAKAWDFTTAGEVKRITPIFNETNNDLFNPNNKLTAGDTVDNVVEAKVSVNGSQVVVVSTNAIATMTDSRDANLSVDELVVYEKGSLPKVDQEFLNNAHATLTPAGEITSDFLDIVKDEVGAYEVTVTGVTKGGKSATKKVVVAVKDENTEIDLINKLMVTGQNFDQEVKDLPLADRGLRKSNAQAWDLAYGAVVRTLTPVISDNILDDEVVSARAKTQVEVQINAQVDTRTLMKKVNANIIDTRNGVLTAKPTVIYHINELEAAANKFIKDAEPVVTLDGDIIDPTATVSSNFETVVKPIIGTYKVKLSAITTGGVATNDAQVVVMVKDDDTIIDPEYQYAVDGNNFIVQRKELALSPEKFFENAKPKAWNLVTGDEVSVSIIKTDVVRGYNINDSLGDHIATIAAVSERSKDFPALKDLVITVADSRLPKIVADPIVNYKKGAIATSSEKFLADAKAKLQIDGVDDNGTLTSNYSSVVKDEIGVFAVTINGVSEGGVAANPKTVNVSISGDNTSEDDKELIYGESFVIKKDEVANLNDTIVIDKAHAKAWSKETALNIDLKVDRSAIKEEVGPYPVTFTTEKGLKHTVIASVVDENTEESTEEALHAKDFMLDVSEVAKLNETVNKRAEVKAWNKINGTILETTADISKVQAKAGSYFVTFKTAKGLVRTVVATVIDENSKVDGETGIHAKNFTVKKSVVEAGLSEADVIKSADAYAWSTKTTLPIKVTTDPTVIEPVPGPYTVTFTAETGLTKKIIVSVIDENTTDNNDNEEALHAKDFTLNLEEVAAQSDTSITTKADAYAWSKVGGINLPLTVDYSKLEAKVGPYPVTFKTVKGTTRTVIASVIDENTEESNEEALHAKDFTMDIKDVPGLKDTVNERAEVLAWNKNSGEILPTIADISNVIEKAGAYEITFTTEKGLKRTVVATVTDDNTDVIDITGIHGRNFKVEKKAVAAGLTEEDVIKLADGYAWSTVTANPIKVSTDPSVIKPEVGPYVVTLVAETGVKRTVIASVIDEETVLTEEEALNAESFIIDIEDVPSQSEKTITERAKAFAWSVKTGASVETKVDYSQLKAEVGPYPVTFTTAIGTKKTVFANVVNEHVAVKPQTEEHLIHGRDFVIRVSDVKNLNHEQIVKHAEAFAWEKNTGQSIEFNSEHQIQPKVGKYPVKFTITQPQTSASEAPHSHTVTATVIDDEAVMPAQEEPKVESTGTISYGIYALVFISALVAFIFVRNKLSKK